jgi:hypothetical protein
LLALSSTVFAISLVIAISGCSSTNASENKPSSHAASDEPAPTVQTPVPVVTPKAIPGSVSFVMNDTDVSGYLFQVQVKMIPLTASVDTVNAPPGQALVTFGGSGVATITSESVGKLAPTFNVLVRSGVAAFWPGQTGICGVPVPSGATHFMFAIHNGYRQNGPAGCTLNFGFQQPPGAAGTLAEGASITTPIVISASQFQVPESDAKTLAASIAAQSQIWLGSGSTPVFDGECTQGAVGDISVMWASAAVDGCNIPNIGN